MQIAWVDNRGDKRTEADHRVRAARTRAGRRGSARARARARCSPGSPLAAALLAQTSAVDEIADRAALQDGNPAELWEVRGETLKQKRSQAGFDAAVRPRLGRAWSRARSHAEVFSGRRTRARPRVAHPLVHDATAGHERRRRAKQLFGGGNDRKSDMEAMVAYVTSESAACR